MDCAPPVPVTRPPSHWALCGVATLLECGAPSRASSASRRRQGRRAVAVARPRGPFHVLSPPPRVLFRRPR
eukprot:scaffold84656_cov36-Phaeocystis_antarctica.AAC.1